MAASRPQRAAGPEAWGADLSDLALANGHRTLRIVGKGNQPALIPLAPRTMRAIDSAVGERNDGPLLARGDGSRLDRHAAGRIVRWLAKRAGIDKAISPHSLRHVAITAAPQPRRAPGDHTPLSEGGAGFQSQGGGGAPVAAAACRISSSRRAT
jgi:integrase